MPELPEVETIRISLEKSLLNRTITHVDIYLDRIIKTHEGKECFVHDLIGKRIEGLQRRGKYLLLTLSQNLVLVIHLRMTGRLLYTAEYEEMTKHTHVVMQLDNGYQLRFVDIRQFGTMYLLNREELDTIKGLAALGPEPLSFDFTCDGLSEKLNRTKRKIKQVLLDQEVVAGIGNIYADEILFEAGILPDRQADGLSREELIKLHKSIVSVIADAVTHRGTSFRDYVDGEGEKGSHQDYLKVYQKTAQPCSRCQCEIKREKIAGRSSHYCPGCQH